MFETISRFATWETMQDDIAKYTKGCTTCQENKPNWGKQLGQLHPHQVPPYPWHTISIDVIGPLPESKSFDVIMIIVYKRTKHPIFILTNTTMTSEGWARILVDNVFKRFGLPHVVISDQGSTFVSKFVNEWYKILGIKGLPMTAYHPRADGQTERMNQEVEIFLRHFINHQQDNWTEWLALAEFSIANQATSSMGVSPFFATQGQHPWTGNPLNVTQTENEAVRDFVKRMAQIQEQVTKSLEAANKIMVERFNKAHKAIEYEEGDKVWLDIRNYTSEWPSKKLDHPRYRPFTITKKHGCSSYELTLPKTWKIFPVFNKALLTPFTEPSYPGQQDNSTRPPPEIIDDDEEYEIEEIIDSRKWQGKLYYLVHWLGYPQDEDSWIPKEDTSHCQNLMTEFHKNHPLAVHD